MRVYSISSAPAHTLYAEEYGQVELKQYGLKHNLGKPFSMIQVLASVIFLVLLVVFLQCLGFTEIPAFPFRNFLCVFSKFPKSPGLGRR